MGVAGLSAPATLPTAADSTLAEATAAYKAGDYARAAQLCQVSNADGWGVRLMEAEGGIGG